MVLRGPIRPKGRAVRVDVFACWQMGLLLGLHRGVQCDKITRWCPGIHNRLANPGGCEKDPAAE